MDERAATNDGFTEPEQPGHFGYAQQPFPYLPPPRKRSKAPIVLTGVGGLVLGLFIGYGAGHDAKDTAASGSVITTTSTTAYASASASVAGAHSSSAAAPAIAKIGGSIALTGLRGDEKLTVTVVKVADPATSSDQYMHPDSGKRWVAVQIRITNTATTAYSARPLTAPRSSTLWASTTAARSATRPWARPWTAR